MCGHQEGQDDPHYNIYDILVDSRKGSLKNLLNHNLQFKLQDGYQDHILGFLINASSGTDIFISLEPEEVKILQEIPSTKIVTEIRSFKGLANTFSCWYPDYTFQSSTMRQLLRKNTA